MSELFTDWLQHHYPLKKDHVLNVLRKMRGGKSYDAAFGAWMRGAGEFAILIRKRFNAVLKRRRIKYKWPELDCPRFGPISRSNVQFTLF